MWKLGLLGLMLVSCTSGAPGAHCHNNADGILNGSVSTAQVGGGCTDQDFGKLGPGKPCVHGADCKPACCACTGASGSNVSVGYCKLGVCASVEEACCTFEGSDSGSSLCP